MVSRRAYRLQPGGEGPALPVARRHDGACPFCGDRLTALFDLGPEHLALVGVDGDRLRVVTCERCTCYGHFLADADLGTGAAAPSPAMERPEYLPGGEWSSLPETDLAVGDERGTPFEAGALDVAQSSLGGQPHWMQGPEHPVCTRCGEPLPFLAQLDMEDFGSEGLIYAFVHPRCGVTATVFQQT